MVLVRQLSGLLLHTVTWGPRPPPLSDTRWKENEGRHTGYLTMSARKCHITQAHISPARINHPGWGGGLKNILPG